MLQPLHYLLKGLQQDPVWREYQRLEQIGEVWPEVVGSAVANHTRPLRLQNQVLQVATSTAAWAQNLVFQRTLILSKLNTHLPRPVKEIRFLPGEWHQSLTPEESGQGFRNASKPLLRRPHSGISATRPQTPQEAFDRWARRVKQSQLEQYPCPVCHCPTPATELERWFVCGYCYTLRKAHPSGDKRPSGP